MYHYNSLLQWSTESDSSLERVLWVDAAEESIFVFRIELKRKKNSPKTFPCSRTKSELKDAFKHGHVRVLLKDPFLRPAVPVESLTEDEQKSWEKLQKDLEPIIKDPERNILRGPEQRRGLISAAAERAGVYGTTIHSLLIKYWIGGQTPQCLLPDYRSCGQTIRGNKGGKKRGRLNAEEAKVGHKIGVALTQEIETLCRRGRDMFYLKEAKTLKLAHQLTLGKFFYDDYELKDGVWVPVLKPDDELPNIRQFKYVHKKFRDPEKECKAREGPKSFQLKGRALLRNTETELLGPGQVAQMDATTADIYLVSEHDPSVIIGRPTIYGIKDAWARFLYSLIATYRHTSYWGGALALENALVNKVAYCAEYGITIKADVWPVNFLPGKILVDHGEMSTYKSDQVIAGLGVDIDVLPAGRGDLKGIIEQHFRKINNQTINWLPGALPRFREDRNKRHELDAVLNIHEFRFFLLEATLKYHQKLLTGYKADADMIAAGVELRPIELLHWAQANRGSQFRHFSLDQARLQLLPGGEAAVTKDGIRFKSVNYTCERAITEKWFERARRDGTFKVQIAIDPRYMEPIYLRSSKSASIEPCQLTSADSRFRGWTWEALDEHSKDQSSQEIQSFPQEAQAAVELHAKVTQIAENAIARQEAAKAENPGQSVASRLNKMPENRKAAKASEDASSLSRTATPPAPAPEEPSSDKFIHLPTVAKIPTTLRPKIESAFTRKLREQFEMAQRTL
jgi:hypothetical protein